MTTTIVELQDLDARSELTQELNPEQSLRVARKKPSGRFWLIFLSLCLSLFLSALELTAVSTALPTIVHDLNGKEFVWIGSAYTLSSTAFLPLSGGIAEIFGRKPAMLFGLAVFTLGSALCGAAQSMTWLIAARTVQGLGGAAINSLTSIILSDMVPLQQRGSYNGLLGMTWTCASAIGPLVGGSLAEHGHWRWIFYLNLPIAGLAFIFVMLFLNLRSPAGKLKDKLLCMDLIGNGLIISSTTVISMGITWGGATFPWLSVHVLLTIIAGAVGMIVFVLYEAFVSAHPIIPSVLVSNRTSISGYVQTFINSLVAICVVYYLPVYYQACKDASPVKSSVDMFSLSFTTGPIVVAAGISVTKTKIYRPQIWFGWILYIIGIGLFSTVRADTSFGLAVGLPILFGVGSGFIYSLTYFPVLSSLPISENAHALALFAFCRSFAAVWGVSIGGTILQNGLLRRVPKDFLGSGISLAISLIPEIKGLGEPLKTQTQAAFGDSLVVLWQTLTGLVAVGLLASLFMENLPLHTHVDEKWGMNENQAVKESDLA